MSGRPAPDRFHKRRIRRTAGPSARNSRPVLLLAIAAMFAIAAPALSANEETALVVAVRHAEKAGEGPDPGISEAGKRRSEQLARMLRDAGITAVYSTAYARTLQTAGPLADALGLDISVYDPEHMEGLADVLGTPGARTLVVGHSNTLPVLVKLLGGKPGSPIDEKEEYDRLYLMTLSRDRGASTVMLRYGAP